MQQTCSRSNDVNSVWISLNFYLEATKQVLPDHVCPKHGSIFIHLISLCGRELTGLQKRMFSLYEFSNSSVLFGPQCNFEPESKWLVSFEWEEGHTERIVGRPKTELYVFEARLNRGNGLLKAEKESFCCGESSREIQLLSIGGGWGQYSDATQIRDFNKEELLKHCEAWMR